MVDLRNSRVEAPVAVAKTFWTPLVHIDLSRVRQYATSVPLVDTDRNPYSRLVLELLADPSIDHRATSLQRFFEWWRPTDAAHVHLGRSSESGLLDALLPTPDCLPWGTYESIDSIAASVQRHERRLVERFGEADGGTHGFRSFGPVSPVASSAFVDEYRRLVESIRTRGYIEGLDDHPSVELLIADENRWSARLRGGNHRLAVLAALGHERTSVTVRHRPIRRTDVESWNGVLLGLYTTTEALEVFDAFVDGTAPTGFPSKDMFDS